MSRIGYEQRKKQITLDLAEKIVEMTCYGMALCVNDVKPDINAALGEHESAIVIEEGSLMEIISAAHNLLHNGKMEEAYALLSKCLNAEQQSTI